MNTPRHPRIAFAGPKALAVLSCALAILAAQPWRTSTAVTSTPAAVRQMTPTQFTQATFPTRTTFTPPQEIRTTAAIAARRQLARDDAHSQLRTTWLLFQHLLAAQLAPLPAPGHPTLDIALFQPVAFTVAPASPPHALACDPYHSPPLPCERTYAIAHHLLAPPC